MPTFPNQVATPLARVNADPLAVVTDLSNSLSQAIGGLGTGKRQPLLFSVANQTEKNAIAAAMPGGLFAGDRVFVADTAWFETFLAGVWKITKTTIPIVWVNTPLGVTALGNAVNDFSYSIDGDRVSFWGYFQFGSTTTVSGTFRVNLPFPVANIATGSGAILLGSALMGTAAGVELQGTVHADATSVIADAANSIGRMFADSNWDNIGSSNVYSSVNPSADLSTVGAYFSVELRYRRQ